MPSTLVVSSPCANCGKTTLLSQLLQSLDLPRVAVKFTAVYPQKHNLAKQIAPAALTGGFAIIDSPDIIDQPNTDTAQLHQTGAQVWWCLTAPTAKAEAWRAVEERAIRERLQLIAVEGSSLLEVMTPDKFVVVVDPSHPQSQWKDKGWNLLAKSHITVVNPRNSDGESDLISQLEARNIPWVQENLHRDPPGDWRDQLLVSLIS